MKSNIFIPKKCKVGFNERSDTYTGVLGYVIYNDGKVWRKESSWESWREKFIEPDEAERKKLEQYNNDISRAFEQVQNDDYSKRYWWGSKYVDISKATSKEELMTLLNYERHLYRNYKESSNEKIKVLEFDNEPLDGFVINKKAGGTKYGWNPRQTYCRIYDPRGFEFEITIPNLLYILENTNSIKGKGLEGKFIYGWDKKDLVLIPEDSPEYQEMVKFTELQDGKVLKKDMVKGNVYLNSQGERLTYLGDAYELDYYGYIKGDKKKLWFARKEGFINYTAATSLKADLNEVDPEFSNLINKIEKTIIFNK